MAILPDDLGFVQIPFLEILDAVLKTRAMGDEARQEIVLIYADAIKAAIEIKKEQKNERPDSV